jgi:hypothetical protein
LHEDRWRRENERPAGALADPDTHSAPWNSNTSLLTDLLFRFFIGGIVVCAFAAISDIFKPKSFAGLFGAAPSVALATLWLTISSHGKIYAAVETRSMIAGAVAFFIYASCATWLMLKRHLSSLAVTVSLIPLWLVVSLGLWFLLLR